MRLSRRQLNRTLLQRQHLLERARATPHDLARHLVGLQAQENLPPYLSLHARLVDFDPYDVTRGLEDRSLVRLLTMRGTIHLLVPDDALMLRPWTQPRIDQELRSSQNIGAARDVAGDGFDHALRTVLAAGPLPQRQLSAALAAHFPGAPPAGLGQLARVVAPLAQLPPRGCWKQSGGVVYEFVDRWVGGDLRPATPEVVEEIVRRYLRAFGPASPADVTAWSAITRLGPVLQGMGDLVRHEDERGKVLYDVSDGVLADVDAPAPVRLLGAYDNLWLSHAGRDRVTEPESRNIWTSVNGAAANTLFAGGMMVGLWRLEDGHVRILETLRRLTKAEQSELDEEITLLEDLMDR